MIGYDLLTKATSVRVVVALSAALIAVSCVAGWSLWRLAGTGARCDARISDARLSGSRAVAQLARGQQAALDLLRADQDADLIRAWAARPDVIAQTAALWQTQWRDAGPAPVCTVTLEQVDAINEVLR